MSPSMTRPPLTMQWVGTVPLWLRSMDLPRRKLIQHYPQVDEAANYSVSAADPKQRVLGVLAFLSNLDGSGNALIVEGNSMAGTEAISDLLFDDAGLLPFLAYA
jgi:hypothetical protein